MKKLPTQTTLKLLPICILIIASVSCRIGDITQTVIEVLLDADHQSINEFIVGRVSESQELPPLSDEDLMEFVNSMSADELDQFVNSLTTEQRDIFIQMLPADKQAELEKHEDAELEPLDAEEEEKEEIKPDFPTGTFSGAFPGESDYSTDIQNEINVEVSSTGVVTGSAIIHFYSETIRENICSSYRETKRTYVVSGQIDGLLDQIVQVDKTELEIKRNFDCRKEEDNKYEETLFECTTEADFRVRSDGTIIISSTYHTEDCGAYLQVE